MLHRHFIYTYTYIHIIHTCVNTPVPVTCRKGEVIPIREVRDADIPGPAGKMPVRIYVPAPENSLPQAGVVYFHGGAITTCQPYLPALCTAV